MRRLARPACEVVLTREGGSRLWRAVNPDAFAIALRNLIENALVHGNPRGPVTVYVSNDPITVSNLAEAFADDEFARSLPSHTQRLSGIGIGFVDRETLAGSHGRVT